MAVAVSNAAFLILDPRWCNHRNKLKLNGLLEKSCLRNQHIIVLKLSIISLLHFLRFVKFKSSCLFLYHLHILNEKKKSATNCVKTCIITSSRTNQFLDYIINWKQRLRAIIESLKWFNLEFGNQNHSNVLITSKTEITSSNHLVFTDLFKINFNVKAVILTAKMTKFTSFKSDTDSEELIPKSKAQQWYHVSKKLNNKLSSHNGKINLKRVFSKLMKNERVLCKLKDIDTRQPKSIRWSYILQKVGHQMVLANKSRTAFYTRQIIHDDKKLSQEICVYFMNFNKLKSTCPNANGDILKYDVDIQVSRMKSTIKDYSKALNVERFYLNVSSRMQNGQQRYHIKGATSSSTSTKESSQSAGSVFSELDSISLNKNKSKCVREKMSTKLLSMFKKLVSRNSKMGDNQYQTTFDDHEDVEESDDTFIKPKRRKKRVHSISSATTNDKPYNDDNYQQIFEKCSHISGGAEEAYRSVLHSPVSDKKKIIDRSPKVNRKVTGISDYTRVRSENEKTDKAKHLNANSEKKQTNQATQDLDKLVNKNIPLKLASDSFDKRTFSVKENSLYSRNGTSIETCSQRNRVCKRKSCEAQNDKVLVEIPRKRKRNQPKCVRNPSDLLHLMTAKVSQPTNSYEDNLCNQYSDFAKLLFCNISEFSAPCPNVFKSPHPKRPVLNSQTHNKSDRISCPGTPMPTHTKQEVNNFPQPNYAVCYSYELEKPTTSVYPNSIKKDFTNKQLDILYSNDAMRCYQGCDFEKDSFTPSFDLDDTFQSINQEMSFQCKLTDNSLINLDNFQRTWADYDAESSLMDHSMSNNTNELSILIQNMKPVHKSDDIYDDRFCYSMPEIKKKICSTDNENTSTETQNSGWLSGPIDFNNFSYNNVIQQIEKTVIEIKRKDPEQRQTDNKVATETSSDTVCGIQTDKGISENKEKIPSYVERKCSPIVSDFFSETKVNLPAETTVNIQAVTQPLFSAQNFHHSIFGRNYAYGTFNSFIPDPFQYWYFGNCLSRNMGYLFPENYSRYDTMHPHLKDESTLVDDIFNETKTNLHGIGTIPINSLLSRNVHESDLESKEKRLSTGLDNPGGRTAKDKADIKMRKSVQFQLKSCKENPCLHKTKRIRQFDEIEDLFYVPKSEEIFIQSQMPTVSKYMHCQRKLKNRPSESEIVECVPSLDRLFENCETDQFYVTDDSSQAQKRGVIFKFNNKINKSYENNYDASVEGEGTTQILCEESEIESDKTLYNSTQTTMFSNVKNKIFVKKFWNKVKNTANLTKPTEKKTVIFHDRESEDAANSEGDETDSARCTKFHQVCEYHRLHSTHRPSKSPRNEHFKHDRVVRNQRAQISRDIFDLSTCFNLVSVEDMVNPSNSDFKVERPGRKKFVKAVANTDCEDPEDILYENIRKSCKNTLQREMQHWLVKETRKRNCCYSAKIETGTDLQSNMDEFYKHSLAEDLDKLRLPPIPEPPCIAEASEECISKTNSKKPKPKHGICECPCPPPRQPAICECPSPPPRQYCLKTIRGNADSNSQNRCKMFIMKNRSKQLLMSEGQFSEHELGENHENYNTERPYNELKCESCSKHNLEDYNTHVNEYCRPRNKNPETERKHLSDVEKAHECACKGLKPARKNKDLFKLSPCVNDDKCYCGHRCRQRTVVPKQTKHCTKCPIQLHKTPSGTICECIYVPSPIANALGSISPNLTDTSKRTQNTWKVNDIPLTRKKPNPIYQGKNISNYVADNNQSNNIVPNVFGFPQPISKRHINCYQSLIDRKLFNNIAESKCGKQEKHADNCFNKTHTNTGLQSRMNYENKFSQTLKASVDNINYSSYSKVNLSNIIMYTESVGNAIIDDFYNQTSYCKVNVDSQLKMPVFKRSSSAVERGICFCKQPIVMNRSNSSFTKRQHFETTSKGIKKAYTRKSCTRRLVRKENSCDLTKKRTNILNIMESNTRIKDEIVSDKHLEPVKLIPLTQLVYDRKIKVVEEFKDSRKLKNDEITGAEQVSSKYNSSIANQLKKDILQLDGHSIPIDIETVSSYPNYIDIDKIHVKKYAGENDDSALPSEYSSGFIETKNKTLLEKLRPELKRQYDKQNHISVCDNIIQNIDRKPINVGKKPDILYDNVTEERKHTKNLLGNVNNQNTFVNESIMTTNEDETPQQMSLYGQKRFQKFWCYRASTDTYMKAPFLSKKHLGQAVTKTKSPSRGIDKQGTVSTTKHQNASGKLSSEVIHLIKHKMQLQDEKKKRKRNPKLRTNRVHNSARKSKRELKESKNNLRTTRRNRNGTFCTICNAIMEQKKNKYLENHYQVNRFSLDQSFYPKSVQTNIRDNAIIWNYDRTVSRMCSLLYYNNEFNAAPSTVSFSMGCSNYDFDNNVTRMFHDRSFKSQNVGGECLDYENLPDLSELIFQSNCWKNHSPKHLKIKEGKVAKDVGLSRHSSSAANKIQDHIKNLSLKESLHLSSSNQIIMVLEHLKEVLNEIRILKALNLKNLRSNSSYHSSKNLLTKLSTEYKSKSQIDDVSQLKSTWNHKPGTTVEPNAKTFGENTSNESRKKKVIEKRPVLQVHDLDKYIYINSDVFPPEKNCWVTNKRVKMKYKPVCTWQHSNYTELQSSDATSEERDKRAKRILEKIESIYPTYSNLIDSLESSSSNQFTEFKSGESNWESLVYLLRHNSSTSWCKECNSNDHFREIVVCKRKLTRAKSGRDKRVTFLLPPFNK